MDPTTAIDPLKLGRILWPDVRFYKQQEEIINSALWNYETYVPAGNMLGKDFVAGFIAVTFFLIFPESNLNHTRVITTSVKDDHLRVLWGEIGRFIQTAQSPLEIKKGGLLQVNHRDIRRVAYHQQCPVCYIRGMVSERGEGLAGHHATNTIAVIDEASGVDDMVYTQIATWADRILVLGNPNPCTNFFFHAVKAGDLRAK